MTATTADQAEQAEPLAECWCCGKRHPSSALLHLDDHSEVTICLWCAEYLTRRAQERRDQMRPSPAGRVRDVLRRGRRVVIEHGWQRLPVIGSILRWLGRYLP
jgi:ribosome-binding protein aMBF1 (putative translation factor)